MAFVFDLSRISQLGFEPENWIVSRYTRQQISSHVHVLVTGDGVWIYWMFITCNSNNCNTIANVHTLHSTTAHAKPQFVIVFTSHCLVVVSNNVNPLLPRSHHCQLATISHRFRSVTHTWQGERRKRHVGQQWPSSSPIVVCAFVAEQKFLPCHLFWLHYFGLQLSCHIFNKIWLLC
jgi:hypothetical protein